MEFQNSEEGPEQSKREDPHWHVYLAVILALGLQVVLPDRLIVGQRYILPAFEAMLLVALIFTNPPKPVKHSVVRRTAAIVMVAITTIANASSLLLLVRFLLKGKQAGGEELIIAALNLFLTNIIVFALWYWELDFGGPVARYLVSECFPDFLFPQYDVVKTAPTGWRPTFVDYLYVSLTNATAFSPTDTLPLTHRAKLLMGAQSLLSLLTVALVAARAVNILS